MNRLALASIVFDAGTQVRAQINEDVVAEYAERMTEGDIFPPVIVFHDGDRHYMADGFQRGMAALRIGFADIDAEVRSGTRQDALWFALEANRRNGTRLNAQDKRHAILLALGEWSEKSNRQIAEQIGCGDWYVGKVRNEMRDSTHLMANGAVMLDGALRIAAGVADPAELAAAVAIAKSGNRVTGKDGKSYPARRTPKIQSDPSESDVRLARALAPDLDASGPTQVRRPTQSPPKTNGNGGLDKSRAAVQARTERIRELAGEGYNALQIAADVGLGEAQCRSIIKREGIDLPAQRAMGKTRRHDANRIIERMLMDAETLTADVGLIDFDTIERARLPEWIDGFEKARDALGAFIRRLRKEERNNVKAD